VILNANNAVPTLKEETSEFAKEEGAQIAGLEENNSEPARGGRGKSVNSHPLTPPTGTVLGRRFDPAFNFISPLVTSNDDETKVSSPFALTTGGLSPASL
jgi:hypothetical protein